uniref:Uncharacterized protein n=1 Tax=Steinernema glaseri TaxID=37863 RepID=A0A1I7YVR0_9BILA
MSESSNASGDELQPLDEVLEKWCLENDQKHQAMAQIDDYLFKLKNYVRSEADQSIARKMHRRSLEMERNRLCASSDVHAALKTSQRILQNLKHKKQEESRARMFALMDERDTKNIKRDRNTLLKQKLSAVQDAIKAERVRMKAEAEEAQGFLKSIEAMESRMQSWFPVQVPSV